MRMEPEFSQMVLAANGWTAIQRSILWDDYLLLWLLGVPLPILY
jgi:hypothetical protein